MKVDLDDASKQLKHLTMTPELQDLLQGGV